VNLTVYQYPQCGTCRQAIRWLKDRGHNIEPVHIVEHPPTEDELKRLIATSGLSVDKFFNTSGEVYRQMGLKDRLRGMNDEEKIRLLASNGKLLKRPIVTDGQKTTVGFKADAFEQAWQTADTLR
jgi:transcriptional regulator, Spx/MgsR family